MSSPAILSLPLLPSSLLLSTLIAPHNNCSNRSVSGCLHTICISFFTRFIPFVLFVPFVLTILCVLFVLFVLPFLDWSVSVSDLFLFLFLFLFSRIAVERSADTAQLCMTSSLSFSTSRLALLLEPVSFLLFSSYHYNYNWSEKRDKKMSKLQEHNPQL